MYTLVAADYQKPIKVIVSRAGYSGTVTSAPTASCDGGGYTFAVLDTPTPDLKTRFSITLDGVQGVTATFTALHNLITTPRAVDPLLTDRIHPGDWIDLPSLHVVGYPVDDETFGNVKIDITSNTNWGGNYGELLRLIVVGINSFNNKNGNGDTPHVVFQFQNLPGSHHMNADDTNATGYLGSEMRKYLVPVDDTHPLGAGGGNFLTGLLAAGVPQDILWAPSRRVANKGGSGADVTADTIADKLWLPTEWEMFGTRTYSNATYETLDNQASFTGFYTTPSTRIKYKTNTNDGDWYWLASPDSNSTNYFCLVNHFTGGATDVVHATHVLGVAPAFCVW
jgi:hypothetical protein